MDTRTLQFENPHFLQSLFANDEALLRDLEEAVPVRVTTRDGWVKFEGSDEAIDQAQRVFWDLEAARRNGVEINQQAFRYAVQASQPDQDGAPKLAQLHEVKLLGGANRKPISPKTAGQLTYLQALQKHDVTFGIGPAGTGKTWLAVAAALDALRNREVKRIVLTRPAVEAGEALGFLPGDLKEKIMPYLRPLYDAIQEMSDLNDLERWVERGILEIAPLAYMRGRTLNNAFVILDEAQNTTCEQMFMFLTRIGPGSRCAITGDPSQTDLKRGMKSGLVEAISALKAVRGIEFCKLEATDVVRHPVVQRIIEAYDSYREG